MMKTHRILLVNSFMSKILKSDLLKLRGLEIVSGSVVVGTDKKCLIWPRINPKVTRGFIH